MSSGLVVLVLALAGAGGAPGAGGASGAAGDTDDDEAAPAVPRRDAGRIVEAVFRRPLAFCHDPRFALTPDDLQWCALMPQKSADARCPDLRAACGRGATAAAVDRREGGAGISLPGLGTFGVTLVWVALGLGVAYLLSRLVRQGLALRLTEARARETPRRAPADSPVVAQDREVETDVERLLQQARAAASAGDFRAAVEDAYAALLRWLEGAGLVRVEAHRTNGDHVREVGRKRPALRPRVEAMVTSVEQVQFGGAAPDAGSFRAIHDGVVGLMGERLGQLLPFVVGLALAATVAGCSLNRGRRDEAPAGRVAVLAFLQQYGFDVRDRLVPLEQIDASVQQLVLLPGAGIDGDGWTALGAWVRTGGTLLVAGGARELPAWIDDRLGSGSPEVSGPLTVARGEAQRFPPVKAIVPPGHELRLARRDPATAARDAPAARPLLVRDTSIYAVEQAHGDGRVIVLADDSLFSNASLLVGDNATLLAELLREGGKRIDVAADLTGLVSPNPFSSVERGRLAPALLQLAFLALLFFACRGIHFGRPMDPEALRRRAFSEHVRALGLQYARGAASRHALEVYGSYVLERLRERLHLVGGRGLQAVAEAVAARTGQSLGEVMRLLVEAHPESPDAKSASSPTEDLATLRQIATLLTATGGAGEHTRPRG